MCSYFCVITFIFSFCVFGCLVVWVWGLFVFLLFFGLVRIFGFFGNGKYVSSLGVFSRFWCCGCRGDVVV